MKPSSVIKIEFFADEHHRKKIDFLSNPLAELESYIDVAALVAEVDSIMPRPVSVQTGTAANMRHPMVEHILIFIRCATFQRANGGRIPTAQSHELQKPLRVD